MISEEAGEILAAEVLRLQADLEQANREKEELRRALKDIINGFFTLDSGRCRECGIIGCSETCALMDARLSLSSPTPQAQREEG